MDIISTRTFQQDGFAITVSHIADHDGDLSYLLTPGKYADVADVQDRIQYEQNDAARAAAYMAGAWAFVGVGVTIRKQTPSNWADGGLEVGRASVWGVESDSPAEYFAELEREMIAAALAEVGYLRQSLCGTAASA